MAKSFLIVGNWKMNPQTLGEARDIVAAVKKPAALSRRAKVVIAPPSVFLADLAAKKSPLFFAAQDISFEVSGAHTGEISAKMVKSAGASYVILGHSERRATGETNETVAEKFSRSVEANLIPILCVGEKKRDGEGDYFSEIVQELSVVLKKFEKDRAPRFVVAYEPVWAVGGSYDNALSPEEMRAMAIFIKKTCAEYFGKEKAMRIPVLYGGSVSSENAGVMLLDGGIDGLLVGRQSLDPKRFSEIIKTIDA